MENYYKQRADYEVTKERLDAKIEEKDQIYLKFFGGRKEVNIPKNKTTKYDKAANYLIELEEKGITGDIDRLKKEVKIKKEHLKNMEKILSDFNGIEYQVLKLRYFDEREYTLEEISLKLGYSLIRIKQVSALINKKIKRFKLEIK